MIPKNYENEALVKIDIPRKNRTSVPPWTNWGLDQNINYINNSFFELKDGKLVAKRSIKSAKVLGGITFNYNSAACGEAGFSIDQFSATGEGKKSFGKTGFHTANKCDGIDIRADLTDIDEGDYFTLNMYHSVTGAANNLDGSYMIFV